jgi:UDP-glucose 6-dehydrogenase
VRELLVRGARVRAFDPVAMGEAQRLLDDERVAFAKDLRDAVEGVHAAVIMTRWPEFGDLPRLLEDRTDPPLVIDGRRMLAPNSVARYEGIGFGPTGGRAG